MFLNSISGISWLHRFSYFPRRVSRRTSVPEIRMKTRLFVTLAFALLTLVAARAQDAPASATSDVWLPGKAWALEPDGTGFTTKANANQPDRRRYFLAENTNTLLLLSVFLEASKAPVPS